MNGESNTLQAAVSMVSAGILALLGVDHLALIWGFIGALVGMTYNKPLPRSGALLSIFVTAMVGAALGTFLADRLNAPGVPVRIMVAMISAAGAQQFVPLLIRAMGRQFERVFGKDD